MHVAVAILRIWQKAHKVIPTRFWYTMAGIICSHINFNLLTLAAARLNQNKQAVDEFICGKQYEQMNTWLEMKWSIRWNHRWRQCCLTKIKTLTSVWIWQWMRVTLKAILTQKCQYRKTSNISRTLVGNIIVDNSDAAGASPVGAAPTTSSFSTSHLASMDWAKTTA